MDAAGGYRRPPRTRGFGVGASLAVLALCAGLALVPNRVPTARLSHAPPHLHLVDIAPEHRPDASRRAQQAPRDRARQPPPAARAAEPSGAPAAAVTAAADAPAIAVPAEALAPARTEPPVPEKPKAPSAEDARAEYAALLWRHIAAIRPRGFNLAGVTQVAFSVAPDGTIDRVRVARPSGNAMLDQLALRTVRRASPAPVPPASLRAEDLAFILPFTFN